MRRMITKYHHFINESVLSKDKREEYAKQAVSDISSELGVDTPRVKLVYDESFPRTHKSFGYMDMDTKEIVVYAANRNLADVIRTIAHEIFHIKQGNNIDEDEANSFAGRYVRKYGKEHPEIFE